MMGVYKKTGGNVIAVEDVPRKETDKYGIVDAGKEKNGILPVKGLVEKPEPSKAPSTLSVVGRYILQPEVFNHLSSFKKGAGGEIQLTDAMARLIDKQPFSAVRFEGKSYDCGSRLGFIEANLVFGLSDPDIGKQVGQLLKKHASQK